MTRKKKLHLGLPPFECSRKNVTVIKFFFLMLRKAVLILEDLTPLFKTEVIIWKSVFKSQHFLNTPVSTFKMYYFFMFSPFFYSAYSLNVKTYILVWAHTDYFTGLFHSSRVYTLSMNQCSCSTLGNMTKMGFSAGVMFLPRSTVC